MNNNTKLIGSTRRLAHYLPNASVFLFLAAVVAVILANSPLNDSYQAILNYPIMLKIGPLDVFSYHGETMTLYEVVNDALMVLFFFVIGLEIRQEMLVGELSSFRKAVLPIIAACGGMLVPVLFYVLVCPTMPEIRGAAIPMATDIAFALAVLSLLGSRVPVALKAFLTALAVVDDIGGIIVIALAYSSGFSLTMLLISFGIIGLIYIAGRLGVRSPLFYYLGLLVVWLFFIQSGVHATISGVLLAMVVPASCQVNMKNLRAEMRVLFNMMPQEEKVKNEQIAVLSADQMHVISAMRHKASGAISVVQILEMELAPIVNYVVLPLFAFVNAGVVLGGTTMASLLSVPLAIFLGLFLGKAIGIFSFTWVAVKTKLCVWPKGMDAHSLLGLSVLGGIGFTVSLFLASLSFSDNPDLFNQAKIGIFCGSIFSGIVGFFWLRFVLKRQERKGRPASGAKEETESEVRSA